MARPDRVQPFLDGLLVAAERIDTDLFPLGLTDGEKADLIAFLKVIAALPLLAGAYYLTTFLYDHSKASPPALDHREHVLAFAVPP